MVVLAKIFILIGWCGVKARVALTGAVRQRDVRLQQVRCGWVSQGNRSTVLPWGLAVRRAVGADHGRLSARQDKLGGRCCEVPLALERRRHEYVAEERTCRLPQSCVAE